MSSELGIIYLELLTMMRYGDRAYFIENNNLYVRFNRDGHTQLSAYNNGLLGKYYIRSNETE